MKRFANWLFRVTHHSELLEISSLARTGTPSVSSVSFVIALSTLSWRNGISEAMERLNLLDKP